MPTDSKGDLRDLLIDAHAHFFFLKGGGAERVKLWQILPNALVIDLPRGAPMRKTVLGYVPTIDGTGVYEIEGEILAKKLPEQIPGTICVGVSPSGVKKLNRRLYPRVSFTPPIDVKIAAEAGKSSFSGRIVNFSAGGLRIESLVELSPTKTYLFNFTIEIEDEDHELNLPGTVAYELPAKDGFVYGIRFGAPSRPAAGKGAKKKEADVKDLDRTIDLIGLINKLLVREG